MQNISTLLAVSLKQAKIAKISDLGFFPLVKVVSGLELFGMEKRRSTFHKT
jgi:hypothetical protein